MKCVHKSDVYLLYPSDTHFNMLYPKFIIKANKEYLYSKLYLSIPGVYQFFNGSRGLHFFDGELRKKIQDNFLKVNFLHNQENYLLTVTHDFSVSTNDSETKIFEDAVICIENLDKNITLDNAKDISFKILTFFSLVFGVSLSIKYISLGSNENEVKYSPLYFISRYSDDHLISYPAKTLVTNPLYITQNEWNTMLNNFFSAKNKIEFEDIWTRFASMYSYTGFWEYKILGYASILDVYSQKLVDEKEKIKIPPSQMKSIKKVWFPL